jgi:meso-butanediol dehydrogenase/(S,S)-butanediol dehydrogenase/diacetyl reductase
MSTQNKPRIAIITGAGRGIGRATAVRLSTAGMRCILVSRSPDELDETKRDCPNEAIVLPADVRDVDQINGVVRKALDRFGRVDVLVNNAGYAKLLPMKEMTAQVWRDTVDINLSSTFHFIRAVWEPMVAQKSGVIVNVSSESARDPFVSQEHFAPELTLAPEEVAAAIYSCVEGDLAITSGETIYVHKRT